MSRQHTTDNRTRIGRLKPEAARLFADDQPTVLAPAELMEQLRQAPVNQPSRDGSRVGDETFVVQPEMNKKKDPQRLSAEFVPPSGQRATGEVTNVWREEQSHGINTALLKLKTTIRYTLPRHKRIIAIGGIALLSIAAAATMARGQKTKPQTPLEQPAVAGPSANQTATARATTEDIPQNTGDKRDRTTTTAVRAPEPDAVPKTDVAASCLKDAVDALVTGRIDDALIHYQRLSIASPRDQSLGLAVQILQGNRQEVSR